MGTVEKRIADQFDAYFAHFDIRIGADEVVVGARREIRQRGWRILLKIVPDDGGLPSLEFYATHRMTNDRHVRISADGHVEHLDAIEELYAYDPKVPGAEGTAHEAYLKHNRRVAEQLRASGLYPDGDINAYLRTGQDEDDPTREDGRRGAHEPELDLDRGVVSGPPAESPMDRRFVVARRVGVGRSSRAGVSYRSFASLTWEEMTALAAAAALRP